MGFCRRSGDRKSVWTPINFGGGFTRVAHDVSLIPKTYERGTKRRSSCLYLIKGSHSAYWPGAVRTPFELLRLFARIATICAIAKRKYLSTTQTNCWSR